MSDGNTELQGDIEVSDEDGFVLVTCGSCDAMLGRFTPDSDHGFIIMKCKKCELVNNIPNNLLCQQIEEDFADTPEIKPGRKGKSKCKCQMKDLLSTGHDVGCPEKR
jgi:hypothetical protein